MGPENTTVPDWKGETTAYQSIFEKVPFVFEYAPYPYNPHAHLSGYILKTA